jgi:phenylalanyl-tRNA synthetase alpha subunit
MGMSIVLDKLDEEKFNIHISIWLDSDDFFEYCRTNFKDVVVDTIIEMISEIVEKDGWNLQYLDEDEREELFISFMENSKITVWLNRETNQMDSEFNEITVKFNLSKNEKKKIAETYLFEIFNNSYYFEECIIKNFDDVVAKFFSRKVYRLLTVNQIKTKFKDKLEKIINYKS